MSQEVLTIEGICGGYGAIKVLKDVDLTVDEKEIVTLIGANGAGKTTLLLTISGILNSDKGSIFFNGDRIDRWPPYKIMRKGVVHIQEERGIFAEMTVKENLQVGMDARGQETYEEKKKEVFDLFKRLRERENQLAGTLSGGEQQMLACGRALMSSPEILLTDEPSLGLAPNLVTEVFNMIERINQQRDIPLLIVEQNARKALQLAERGYVLRNGEIHLKGKTEDLLSNPMVKETYLGGG